MYEINCRYCSHLSEPIGESTCIECVQSAKYSNFDVVKKCITCVFANRGWNEHPCNNCHTVGSTSCNMDSDLTHWRDARNGHNGGD